MKKLVSLLLALTLVLGTLSVSAHADEIKDLRDYALVTSEMTTFCYQYSQSNAELKPLSNCFDMLLTNDSKGRLLPCIAKEWYTPDDATTWVFELRDDVKWVDYLGNYVADVVAEDFVYGLEWVLNYAKNQAANTSMPVEMILGAQEYYDYTKAFAESNGEDAAKALDPLNGPFAEMVGIKADNDAGILTITCLAPLPYFPTVTTYNCLAPLSAKLIEKIGVDGYFGAENTDLWYNGPYTMTDYVQNNEKVLTRNPLYYNNDVKLFDTVTVRMVEDANVAFTMFTAGELDYVELTESEIDIIANNPSNEWHDYLVPTLMTIFSYNFKWNFNKYLEDGTPDVNWNTAVANEAFRKSVYYGLDLTNYLARTNTLDPQSIQNYTYTMRGLVQTSDGTDYSQLVLDELGLSYDPDKYNRYDPEKAAAYKSQAIEELTALGVTFPIELDWYIAGSNQVSKDTADVLTQMFNDYLGSDYINFVTKTYVSKMRQEVANPRLQSLIESGWAADYGDPMNFVGQEILNYDNAYYATVYTNANDAMEPAYSQLAEFTRLVNEADQIRTDLDARYAAFAKAEAYFLDKALCLPSRVYSSWQLSCINFNSKIQVLYGVQETRYVDWETQEEPYTAEEYALLINK